VADPTEPTSRPTSRPGTRLRFDGRVAVVTGAGRGLGRAYAELLASLGARVVVNDIGVDVDGSPLAEDPASEVVAGIVAAGGTAVVDHHSVATEEGGAAIVDTALDAFGRIDVLVNNAGAQRLVDGPEHVTDEILDMTIRTHLYGCFHTVRRAWPLMAAQGYGRICNISSSTMLGIENSWDYPAAKGGIFALTRSLAIVGAPLGITINSMMPRRTHARCTTTRTRRSASGWRRASGPTRSHPRRDRALHRRCRLDGRRLRLSHCGSHTGGLPCPLVNRCSRSSTRCSTVRPTSTVSR